MPISPLDEQLLRQSVYRHQNPPTGYVPFSHSFDDTLTFSPMPPDESRYNEAVQLRCILDNDYFPVSPPLKVAFSTQRDKTGLLVSGSTVRNRQNICLIGEDTVVVSKKRATKKCKELLKAFASRESLQYVEEDAVSIEIPFRHIIYYHKWSHEPPHDDSKLFQYLAS